jgi:hypothetical protein
VADNPGVRTVNTFGRRFRVAAGSGCPEGVVISIRWHMTWSVGAVSWQPVGLGATKAQPVTVGNRERLTNTSRVMVPPTDTDTLHLASLRGTVNDTNAIVATAAPHDRMSTAIVPGRICQAASLFRGDYRLGRFCLRLPPNPRTWSRCRSRIRGQTWADGHAAEES